VYLVFARKYRPRSFEDVVGQSHVARTLQNAVRNGRVHHAYLFCGSRGIGKTSMARILASALNCAEGPTPEPCGECDSCRRIASGDDMDVMEIDGASNRGIDEVRELRQNVKYSPTHSRYKIYYVDEVHMLTRQAFNALLKTLEEPPEHVKFIFSATDPQQLPDTVKSRCQRFDFRRISDAEIVKHLRDICDKEELEPQKGALEAMARAARGGMRDAVGTLDQVAAFGGEQVRLDDVLTVLGAARTETLSEIVDALAGQQTGLALRKVHEVLFGGVDLLDFTDQMSEYIRDLLVATYCEADDDLLAGAVAGPDTLQRQAAEFAPEQLLYMIQILREAKLRARRDTTGRLGLEMAIVKLSRLDDLTPIDEALEQLAGGGPAPNGGATGKEQSRRSGPSAGTSKDTRSTTAPPRDHGTDGGQSPDRDSSSKSSSRAKGLMERLKKRKMGGSRKNASPSSKKKEPGPEGIDASKFRRIQSVAEDPATARQAQQDQPLLRAFKEADMKFGLEPVQLRRENEKADEEEATAEEAADETA
jgi:DNA polymerase-3 subunit gamma/tau